MHSQLPLTVVVVELPFVLGRPIQSAHFVKPFCTWECWKMLRMLKDVENVERGWECWKRLRMLKYTNRRMLKYPNWSNLFFEFLIHGNNQIWKSTGCNISSIYLNTFIYISLISVECSEHLCSRWDNATFMMAAGTKFRAPMGEWVMMENVQCQLGGPVSVREGYWEQYNILLNPPPPQPPPQYGTNWGGGGWSNYTEGGVQLYGGGGGGGGPIIRRGGRVQLYRGGVQL